MKKKSGLLLLTGITALLLGACDGPSPQKATIVILDDNHKEVQRIEADNYGDYSDGKTAYWIGKEKHLIKNVPHDIITQEKEDKDE